MQEYYDEGDKSSFSLVLNGVALLNGYIGSNGLMNVQLEPVSAFLTDDKAATVTNVSSDLLHRRLGHLGKRYLKEMCDHNSMEESWKGVENKIPCVTCLKSKATQLPYNHTRPRASCFLENVHVDLSGIIRTKGLNQESYYALFCDDYFLYRHIYPLKTKDKFEVHNMFMNYVALAGRQTRQKGRKRKKNHCDQGTISDDRVWSPHFPVVSSM